MSGVQFPGGLRIEPLGRAHPRRTFRSGAPAVDEWLAARALQNQEKHLSSTKLLIDQAGHIAGYYTLATGQVDFGDLPPDLVRRLPRRMLPVAILAWLGVSEDRQGRGLGGRLLAQALRDCYAASNTFAFIAIILDCIDDRSKAFYRKWGFEELPGSPYRLYLSMSRLESMMEPSLE